MITVSRKNTISGLAKIAQQEVEAKNIAQKKILQMQIELYESLQSKRKDNSTNKPGLASRDWSVEFPQTIKPVHSFQATKIAPTGSLKEGTLVWKNYQKLIACSIFKFRFWQLNEKANYSATHN